MVKSDLLKPAQVFAEYGIKTRALAYLRECSDDQGKLIGPLWINPKDTDIYYYKREWIEAWIIKDTVQFDVPELQNDKKDNSKPNLLNFPKKPNHTK
jgi:hypothetical protein